MWGWASFGDSGGGTRAQRRRDTGSEEERHGLLRGGFGECWGPTWAGNGKEQARPSCRCERRKPPPGVAPGITCRSCLFSQSRWKGKGGAPGGTLLPDPPHRLAAAQLAHLHLSWAHLQSYAGPGTWAVSGVWSAGRLCSVELPPTPAPPRPTLHLREVGVVIPLWSKGFALVPLLG